MGVVFAIKNSVIGGSSKRFFKPEISQTLAHKKKGVVSMVTLHSKEAGALAGSQFYITLTDQHLDFLDGKQAIFGQVAEGLWVI